MEFNKSLKFKQNIIHVKNSLKFFLKIYTWQHCRRLLTWKYIYFLINTISRRVFLSPPWVTCRWITYVCPCTDFLSFSFFKLYLYLFRFIVLFSLFPARSLLVTSFLFSISCCHTYILTLSFAHVCRIGNIAKYSSQHHSSSTNDSCGRDTRA